MKISLDTHYKCRRCDGAGMILKYDYWKGGTCFACKGAGWFEKKYRPAKVAPIKMELVATCDEDWPVGF